jgi:carbonic anhydrase
MEVHPMSLSSPSSVAARWLPRVLVLALTGSAAGDALAADAHAASAPAPAKAAAAPAAAPVVAKPAAAVKDDHAAPAKPAAPAAAAPTDPLDVLRERLATRLGATKAAAPAAGGAGHVVQVSSRATGEFQVTPGRPAAPRAASNKAKAEPGKDAHGGAGGHGSHWSYRGETGPQNWGALRPDFTKCATGTRQSPIDIRDGFPVELEPVRFEYRPSNFSVIDNGHTVQVNVGPANSIEVQGRVYELVQFHFHRPSEERINGRASDMVAHLVHKDPEGRLAVVAVLLDRGAAQPVIQAVWNNLPLEKNEANPARSLIDLNQLLPADRRYFTYMGSLTTPPCSEGVLWMVMKQPVTVSTEQIELFSRLYPMNARPIQSAAGRVIKESN